MREILFRGKRVSDGEWVYGYYIKADDQGHKYGIHKDCIAGGATTNGSWLVLHDRYPVVPATIGQYTGLTDKNGKKIFEGDIVEHHLQGDILVNRGVVNWDKEHARWAHQLNTMNPCFALYKPKTFEVIGNIHDNPELIGG